MADWDMFHSEPLQPEDDTNGNMNASCPLNETFTFNYIIFFNWNEEFQRPFKIFSRKQFGSDEIKDRCYEKYLSDEFRVWKIKPLKSLPGQKLSLFAKVEGCKYEYKYKPPRSKKIVSTYTYMYRIQN